MKEWIIMLVIVALMGAISAIVLTDFKESFEDDDLTSIVNESVTITSNRGLLSHSLYAQSLQGVWNSTDTVTTQVNFSGGAIFVNDTIAGGESGSGVINVSYTYYTPTHQRNMTENGLAGQLNSTSYLGTIGTILGVTVLIGLVIGAFYFITKK